MYRTLCLFVILLVLGSPDLRAQKTFGVIEYAPADASFVLKTVNDSLLYTLQRMGGIQHFVYNLEEPELKFLPLKSSKPEEHTADYVLYYTFTLYENYTPDLNIKTDGTTSSATFNLSVRAETRCKFVDLVTNTVLLSRISAIQDAIPTINALSMTEADGVFVVDNYKQFFSADPGYLKANNQREYQAGLTKAHDAYKKKFNTFFSAKSKSVVNSIIEAEMYFLFRDPIPVTEATIENEKAKDVTITLPYPVMLPANVYMKVAALDTFNGYVIPDLFGDYYVKKNTNGKLLLDAGLASKAKQAGEAHLAGKKLFASFSTKNLSKKLSDDAEQIKLGINSGSVSIQSFEVGMVGLKGISVVDLSFTKTINRFREHYKQEVFIDDDFSAKSIGARYLIQGEGKTVNLLEVETGTLIGSYNTDEGLKGFMDEAMGLFDKEIEVVNITKEKNGKAQKVRLYSPFGFQGDHFFKIYELIPENVAGKTKLRSAEIAECSDYGVYQSISEFNVTRGEDLLYDAIQRGATLRFRNRTFSFLGQQYK